jgi:hypothetical protein
MAPVLLDQAGVSATGGRERRQSMVIQIRPFAPVGHQVLIVDLTVTMEG